MAKYFASALLTTVILIGVFVEVFRFQVGVPTESSRWIYESYDTKFNSAKIIKSPKIVVVGGSGTHFGVRAEMLSESLEMPSINIGTHAGLGLRYILVKAQTILNTGDVALLAFEYPMYADADFGEISIDYILSRDAEYFSALPVLVKLRIIASTKFSRVVTGVRLAIDDEYVQPGSIRYDSSTINEFGDETSNLSSAGDQSVLARLEPAFNRFDPDSSSLQAIGQFLEWTSANDVEVIVSYPPLLFFVEYESDAYSTFFSSIEQYWQDKDVSVVGTPHGSMYPQRLMYDTLYHLNSIGAQTHTDKLIDQLGDLASFR